MSMMLYVDKIYKNIFVRILVILTILKQNFGDENSFTQIQEISEIKKLLSAKCSTKYTLSCFLMDVCYIIDKFSSEKTYQIVPGVYVVHNGVINRVDESSIDIFKRAIINNQSDLLDTHALKKLNSYLDSLSLTLKIMDRKSAFSLRKFSDDILTEFLPGSRNGRGKKKYGVMWAAGAIAALGSSALFVITGKAAIASFAALMLSMICYFKGTGSAALTSSGAISSPNKRDCPETVIDVNGRDYNHILPSYLTRTTEDNWTYPRYSPTSTTTDQTNIIY